MHISVQELARVFKTHLARKAEFHRTNQNDPHGISTAVQVSLLEVMGAMEETLQHFQPGSDLLQASDTPKASPAHHEHRFLIWSNEHFGWWKPNHMGYTKDPHEAGEYTWGEAMEILLNANKYVKPGALEEEVAVRIR